jgi:CTP synthase
MPNTKYIVVSGGVLSGLGKGIVSASIGRLLRGYKVIPIKCDGYLNIDPGTMNPYEHGEVFVQDDGGEVDMDFGHYERFMGIKTKFKWNITSGKIFKSVIDKEREGKFLGQTVQIIPHVTNEIKERIRTIAEEEKAEIVILEIGGTAGDLENRFFFEAIRQMKLEMENMIFIHLTYVPFLKSVGEHKTKPTQQSATIMMQMGLQPDIIIARSRTLLNNKNKEKIALFCNVSKDSVISNYDTTNVYEMPIIFKKQNLDLLLRNKLRLIHDEELIEWEKLIDNINNPEKEIKIAICGKYTDLKDSYVSVTEALRHAGAHLKTKIKLQWIESFNLEELKDIDGIIVPGGFGSRGSESKIKAVRFAREKKIPYLGLCLGMQMAVIDFARHVCKLKEANSTEFIEKPKHPVVCLLPGQRKIYKKGGTMRLGGQDVFIKPKTQTENIFGQKNIRRRFRHRYEVNPKYVPLLERHGLIFSGSSRDGKIKQIIELKDHPFFMASQFHPEFHSSLEKPDEMFFNFVKSCKENELSKY